MDRRRTRIVAAIAVALLIGWFLWWRSPGVQVPRAFAKLKAEIQGGDAAGTLAVLHPDYDLRAQFPNLAGESDDPRRAVLGLLFAVYQMQREDPFIFDYTLGATEPQPDGSMVVRATIHLSCRSGQLPFVIDPTLRRRFVLRRHGWLGVFLIVDHDRIAIDRP